MSHLKDKSNMFKASYSSWLHSTFPPFRTISFSLFYSHSHSYSLSHSSLFVSPLPPLRDASRRSILTQHSFVYISVFRSQSPSHMSYPRLLDAMVVASNVAFRCEKDVTFFTFGFGNCRIYTLVLS